MSDVAVMKEKVSKIDDLEMHLLTIRKTFSSVSGKLDQQAGLLEEFLLDAGKNEKKEKKKKHAEESSEQQ